MFNGNIKYIWGNSRALVYMYIGDHTKLSKAINYSKYIGQMIIIILKELNNTDYKYFQPI